MRPSARVELRKHPPRLSKSFRCPFRFLLVCRVSEEEGVRIHPLYLLSAKRVARLVTTSPSKPPTACELWYNMKKVTSRRKEKVNE